MPLISTLARIMEIGILMTNHCESWRGSGFAFLAESSFCVSLFCDQALINLNFVAMTM
jgi:hypothetical protein